MLKEVLKEIVLEIINRCTMYGYEIVKQRTIMGIEGIAEGILILIQSQMRLSYFPKEAKDTSPNSLCPFYYLRANKFTISLLKAGRSSGVLLVTSCF